MDTSISILDPFEAKPKGKLKPFGGSIGFFEDFELEEIIVDAPSQVVKAGAGIFGDLVDLLKNDIIGGGSLSIGGKTEMRFDSQISFNQQQEAEKKEETSYKKDFYQKLESTRKETKYIDLEQTMQELARLEVGVMSTDEKNKTLHLSADYDEKNIRDPYHLHALRQKKLEQFKEVLQDQKDSEMVVAGGANLTMRLDANEGQSMVSQSGAIMSAG